ncbi:amidase [Bacillus luteolus]|uniref:Amidase n=1 Tax=Litchfieldia luteola TaxID=682179 RepID=A0ABR9QIV1_9BACI|nr:amidase family protein [Cytobacillus luteolus]MBE4908394.1 amidase [Cytobacillus luteolus]MBP1943182.1 amidase [Cytobacillus luteolus]
MQDPKLKELYESWLNEATIDDIQSKMESGELTSQELVVLYLKKIAEYDHKINSILEVNPEAIHIAAALDAERKIKGARGPLHGIPVLIKDNIDTSDKMHTSAGSLALQHSIALKDSFVAAQLRKAGAVILGKTNMTEWANFMTIGMPSGYSSRGGQVLNPYGPNHFDVGGSSSGSGAAIAANFATVAVGTETSGSILSPASQNSLVGIKPTLGLISRSGIIPIAHSQDTAGPMARTVKDAAYLLTSLVGKDDSDPITKSIVTGDAIDYASVFNNIEHSSFKVGIAREIYFEYLSEEKREILNNAIEKLQELGMNVIDGVSIPSTQAKWSYDVLTYEFKSDLNGYLNGLHPSMTIRSLEDIIRFNREHKEDTLKYGQKLLVESQNTSGTLKESEYIDALEFDRYHSTKQGIDFTLAEHSLDAIVFPNNYGAAIPAKAGYPSITVPAGYTKEGEPVGITFTGAAFSESTLLKIAYTFEQFTKHRQPPKW